MKNASLSKQGLIYKYIENLSMMKKPSVEIKMALMSALLYMPSKEIMKKLSKLYSLIKDKTPQQYLRVSFLHQDVVSVVRW